MPQTSGSSSDDFKKGAISLRGGCSGRISSEAKENEYNRTGRIKTKSRNIEKENFVIPGFIADYIGGIR